jgi:hypothetical protein
MTAVRIFHFLRILRSNLPTEMIRTNCLLKRALIQVKVK